MPHLVVRLPVLTVLMEMHGSDLQAPPMCLTFLGAECWEKHPEIEDLKRVVDLEVALALWCHVAIEFSVRARVVRLHALLCCEVTLFAKALALAMRTRPDHCEIPWESNPHTLIPGSRRVEELVEPYLVHHFVVPWPGWVLHGHQQMHNLGLVVGLACHSEWGLLTVQPTETFVLRLEEQVHVDTVVWVVKAPRGGPARPWQHDQGVDEQSHQVLIGRLQHVAHPHVFCHHDNTLQNGLWKLTKQQQHQGVHPSPPES